MEIKICENRQEWKNFNKQLISAEFLQSWDWGEFQKSTGKEVLRLQIFEGGEVVEQMQGFVHNLGLGVKYLYLPRASLKSEVISHTRRESLFGDKFFKEQGFSFIRIEAKEELRLMTYDLYPRGIPLRGQLTKNRQPGTTLLLDLEKSEENLLKEMHAKTRYNIGLAEKRGLIIKPDKDTDVFWKLNEATTGRDKFKSHDKNYYAKMLENNFCHQLTVYYNYQAIASDLFIVYGDTCTYLHGTSANEYRNLMAPYLLQWEGIKLAKRLGCKFYDFWGIAPILREDAGKQVSCFNNFCWDINHLWTGVTRFKVGFGGTVREYPQAVDVVLNKWKYVVYKLARKLKGLN